MGWITLASRKVSNGFMANEYALALMKVQNQRSRLKDEMSFRLSQLENEEDLAIKNSYAYINYNDAKKALDDAKSMKVNSSTTTTDVSAPFKGIDEFTYDEAKKLGLLSDEQLESVKKLKNSINMDKCSQIYNSETKELTIQAENGATYTIDKDGNTRIESANTSYSMVPIDDMFEGNELSYNEIKEFFNEKQAKALHETKDETGRKIYGEYFLASGKYDANTNSILLHSTAHSDEYLLIEEDGTVYNVTRDGRRYDASIQKEFFRGANQYNCLENLDSNSESQINTIMTFQKAKENPDITITEKQEKTYERITKGIKNFDENAITRVSENGIITVTCKDGTVHVVDNDGNENVTLANGITYNRAYDGTISGSGIDFDEFVNRLTETQLNELLEIAGVKNIDDLKAQYKQKNGKLKGSLFLMDDNGNATIVKANGEVATLELSSSDRQSAKNNAIKEAEQALQVATTDFQNEQLIITRTYTNMKEDIEDEVADDDERLSIEQSNIEAALKRINNEDEALKSEIKSGIQNSTIFS